MIKSRISVVRKIPAPTAGHCAVCQKSAEDVVCECCKQQWDPNSEWVKGLIKLELRWRRINRRETQFAPLHISVDGQLRRAGKRVSISYLLRQRCQISHVEDRRAIREIDLWAVMGGLTSRERLIYQIMMSRLNGYASAALMAELEHRHVSKSAYLRYRKRVLQKLQRAALAV